MQGVRCEPDAARLVEFAEPDVAEFHDGVGGVGEAAVILEEEGAGAADGFLAAAGAFLGQRRVFLDEDAVEEDCR